METDKSSVLLALAERYQRSRAGRTGQAAKDLLIDYEALLSKAGCAEGEARVCAERDLRDAEIGILAIERHRRTNLPLRVRFSSLNEESLFQKLGIPTPVQTRSAFAALFHEAAASSPERWQSGWTAFCRHFAATAESGRSVLPFSRDAPDECREILSLLPRLLAWNSESLRRFASSRLCGDSKRLESLQSRIESCLDCITSGTIRSLEDVGILENERAIIVRGPLRLRFPEGNLDLGLLSAPARIDRRDLRRAVLETSATCCLTVENLSVLHELARSSPGTLLASSGSEGGFAHSAIIEFLRALAESVTCWHCGDTDPKGFEILHNLRERAGRPIHSLGMTFDSTKEGPRLNAADCRTIDRLMGSLSLTDTEKQQLSSMQSAGHKGVFEQEARPLPFDLPTMPQ